MSIIGHIAHRSLRSAAKRILRNDLADLRATAGNEACLRTQMDLCRRDYRKLQVAVAAMIERPNSERAQGNVLVLLDDLADHIGTERRPAQVYVFPEGHRMRGYVS